MRAESMESLCTQLSSFFSRHHHQHKLSAAQPDAKSLLERMNEEARSAEVQAAAQKCSFSRARTFFQSTQPAIPAEDARDEAVPAKLPTGLLGTLGKRRENPIHIEEDSNCTSNAPIQQAKDYLSLVKQHLPSPATRHFTILLKSYKAQKLDCPSLLRSLLALFDEHGCLHLINGFEPFVSARNKVLFGETVQAYKKGKSGEKENLADLCKRAESKVSSSSILFPSCITATTTSGNIIRSSIPQVRPHIRIEPVTDRLLAKQPSIHPPPSQPEVCPICRDRPEKPFKAKCGHVCCFGCWSAWLGNTLECPVCRRRTRISQLTKIYQ